mgnify:CR=1 FL=1
MVSVSRARGENGGVRSAARRTAGRGPADAGTARTPGAAAGGDPDFVELDDETIERLDAEQRAAAEAVRIGMQEVDQQIKKQRLREGLTVEGEKRK